jgi:OmcA/MtrC family decaheme c-type cytochrome
MKKFLIALGVLLLASVLLVACSGAVPVTTAPTAATEAPVVATEAPVATQAPATVAEVAFQPETCGVCHKDAGEKHQASYDELYQDGAIQVTDLNYKFTAAPDTTVITFKMTKNGQPISGASIENLNAYFVQWTGTAFEGAGRLSLKGKLTYDPKTGVTTSTLVEKDPTADGYVDYSNVSGVDGLIVVYGYDKQVGSLPARIRQVQFPYAALLQTGKGVTYVSAANNDGCEKCHTDPYLKHGNIYGQVNGDPATDFLTCKACHLDNGEGGHFEWQLLVDDPAYAAEYLAKGEDAELPADKAAAYAYKTTLMNDVHMSHAMEFPYPQSMSNCATCHEGKLDTVLSDANFKVETCKSCHPVTGAVGPIKEGAEEPSYDTTKVALKTIMPESHKSMDLNTTDCASCHGEAGRAPAFKQIHSGYDKTIYTADGVRYSDAIVVTVDSASFADNKLTFAFSAAQPTDTKIEGIDLASIQPTVMVGLYGWDTKDYIVGPHERLVDDNADGKIDSKDSRALEFVVGEESPRFTTVLAEGGKWEVTADLSAWADKIADGTVKRVEIAVMPALVNADEVTLALDAPSRTFDLAKNDFDDEFFSPIVKVADGCENCHGALATNYHSPDRGGNIVVCRMCHITKTGSSHLEMQSRSIDSFIHAVHSSQAFDVADVNFADPVEAMHYDHHVEFTYPTHGTNCESCHVAGAYNVPDQSKSLPGLLSASESFNGRDRTIAEVPSYVVGPASRACGGCHRAELINEDKYGDLVAFNVHTAQGGYMIEPEEDASSTLTAVIEKVMTLFK